MKTEEDDKDNICPVNDRSRYLTGTSVVIPIEHY